MYPLSGSSGENEHNAPKPEPEVEVTPGELFVWFLRFATVGYTIGFLSRLWADDEIRLHVLHASVRVLQTTARIVGGWALKTEKSYNEYVNTLH